jgi:luciferase family oxidoreductase group 1
MLPNHAPLVIAEQFGTLASLYPGRIDLGLGRAPGGDPATARALRRHLPGADAFPEDLLELLSYFNPADPRVGSSHRGGGLPTVSPVRAVPGEGLGVPFYLLGSSDFSARLAGRLGMPFAFASHFAPDYLHAALHLYRTLFEPSADLARPHAMVTVNVIAADTDAEARRLFSSLRQSFLNLLRGRPDRLPPPLDAPDELDATMSPPERERVDHMTHYSLVGSPDTIRAGLEQLLADTGADEVIATGSIYDHAARLRSFELAAGVFRDVGANRGAGAGASARPAAS